MPHQLLSINYFLIRYCIANDVQVSQLGLPLLQCCLCRDERFIFEGDGGRFIFWQWQNGPTLGPLRRPWGPPFNQFVVFYEPSVHPLVAQLTQEHLAFGATVLFLWRDVFSCEVHRGG